MEMLVTSAAPVIQQHLIDPEICIRCNTCEATCPTGAITHDSRNYVVKVDVCNGCMACVPPCPTGSIDHWHSVSRDKIYSTDEQLSWDELPAKQEHAATEVTAPAQGQTTTYAAVGSTIAPASALKPQTNLYSPKNTITAKVTGNVRVTALGESLNDTHHIVLDFGSQLFPVLEGQSIGIIPSGTDTSGRAHFPRQYSIASPRNGERAGFNNLSLTVKRVLQDYQGNPIQGVASNYVCDLKIGDSVQVVGPFGSSFLMPNEDAANLIMICTGTGSAPMRGMTEWQRREKARLGDQYQGGRLMLFFGARTQEELPYFGPLQKLSKDFIDLNFAFSRTVGQPKKYVQDVMRERANDVAALLKSSSTYIYVCGLKGMEEGVLDALRAITTQAGKDWKKLAEEMRVQGRLHLETY